MHKVHVCTCTTWRGRRVVVDTTDQSMGTGAEMDMDMDMPHITKIVIDSVVNGMEEEEAETRPQEELVAIPEEE